MNFLAHAVFADGPDDVLFGSVAGDLIGIPKLELPDTVRAGTALHADLDTLFDNLPELAQSRQQLYGEEGRPMVRHYQNAVLDVCSDHVLALRWPQLFDGDLVIFADDVYRVLGERQRFLTQSGQEMVDRLIRENWLVTYGTQAGLETALTRISHRVRNGQLIRDKMDDVMKLVPLIEGELLSALPALRGHMSNRMAHLGFHPEGRIQWKEGNTFKESISGGTERK